MPRPKRKQVILPEATPVGVLYTTDEIAQLMKTTRRTVQRWIREGKLRAVQVGGQYMGQTGRTRGLSKGTLARRQRNSASSDLGRDLRTDAVMDKPWHKYTSLRPRKQRLWTVRASQTPGLPSVGRWEWEWFCTG